MKLSTPISELTTYQLRKLIEYGVEYCKRHLGVNGRHKSPISTLLSGKVQNEYYGEYLPTSNKIVLYRNTNKNVKGLIHTLIHEYTHSLQPIKTKYHKILNEVGYSDHPHEIEANKNGDEHYRGLWFSYKRSLK